MAEYNLLPIEQETVVNFNRGEKTLYVYTHEKSWKKKILNLWEKNPDSVYFRHPKDPTKEKLQALVDSPNGYMDVELPDKKWVKFTGPSTRGQNMTEEQKKAIVERFRLAREARNASAEDIGEDIGDEDEDEDIEDSEE